MDLAVRQDPHDYLLLDPAGGGRAARRGASLETVTKILAVSQSSQHTRALGRRGGRQRRWRQEAVAAGGRSDIGKVAINKNVDEKNSSTFLLRFQLESSEV